MRDRRPPQHYPSAPILRRIYAFLLDFCAVWFVSLLAALPFFQFVVFFTGWMVLRVLVVARWRGQSLGRWAFDLIVIDPRRRRIPDLIDLAKREGALAIAGYLAVFGIEYGLPNGLSFSILISPLIADLVVAIADENQLALHDRLANTLVVPTKRGFSLDVRVRRWVALFSDRVQR
ncbi:RDD domain containing protein [Rubidibacter lacunae KORDI 51-2]|uniref:RDD domain containing protein n=1 Tax=Rubidibacter lacunae KORDI 51-2 TaxID=582515 RepID=U5D8Q4_9CHRO|nr:RDD family protein [Rubidibacter lacunae]ERN40983.1 RDD domain containing protein [Rubidibacter lacunae KORDI 51-2]